MATEISSLKTNFVMDTQEKTKEEFQRELIELRQEYNSLKELYDKEKNQRKYSYDEMPETNLKLTLAMQGGNMAWWEMDVPTGHVTFDKHKVEMLGYPPENFKHYTDFTSLVHPKDYKRIMDAMKDHLDGTLDKYEAEYRILANSGEYIWFYDFGSVVKKDAKGTPLICTGFVFNISERKNAEKRLLKIMKALDSASDAIAISDSLGHQFYQNKALSDLFGYETAEETEAAGGGMARVKDPVIAKQMFSIILDGKSWSGELEMVTKSGRVFPAYECADAIKDNEGNIIGVINIITDITERSQAEKTLQDIIDYNPMAIQILDAEGYSLKVNQAFMHLYGSEPPSDYSMFNDVQLLEKGFGKLIDHIKNGEVVHFPDMPYNPNDSLSEMPDVPIWVRTIVFPLVDGKGKPEKFVFMHENITEQKNREDSLAKSERLLSSIFDSVGDLLFLLKVEAGECYRFISVNNAYSKATGLNKEMLVGKLMSEVIPEQSLSNVKAKHRQAIKESSTIRWEDTFDYPNGRLVGDISITPIFNEKGFCTHLVGSVHDITERRQAEEILLKSEQMLQTVMDNFPGVVFWKDRQSNYLGCNQSFATGAGLKNPAEIVGKTDLDMPWGSTEAINYCQDDSEVMESGKGRMHIIETQHQSEGQVIWLDTSKLPLWDSLGQIIGVIGVSTDISKLKSAEQELIKTNKELLLQNDEKEKRAAELINAKNKAEASDRLKTAFMNNISHEIRTPLNIILGFAPFIIQPDTTMEEKEEYLGILNFGSDRLMNTITDIMDISLIISGNMDVHPQPIDISSLLTDVFEHFQEPCKKKNLGLKMQFPDNGEKFILNTDREMLRKAVSKLVDNSVKFTKEGCVTLGFELINNEIEIFVKDTGIGIEKDAQELIFNYFMQEDVSNTRGYEGSGLGLSITKGIVQLLGGKIRLESTKNMGTIVFLTLPDITATTSSKPKNLTNAINVEGMPIILIAEDDDSSYYYIETLLGKHSKTLRACNGQEAIDLCRKHPDINLVLMDIKMPVMNGIEATLIIKSFRSDLPIIAVTAYAQIGDEFKITEAGCDDYLSKPINKTELLSLIQKHFKK